MKRRFAVGGGILGFVWIVIAFIRAYVAAPSAPGLFELLIQLLMLGVCTVCGAAGGYLLGCVADLVLRRRGAQGKEHSETEGN